MLHVFKQEKTLVVSMFKHGRLHSLCVFPSAVQVNDVVFSSDETHFATCSEDGSVRVWSTPSNELVVQFQVLNQVREYTHRNILKTEGTGCV